MAFGDLKYGERSTGVRDFQAYLVRIGFKITVDGVFGPQTRAAVLAFQRQRGISADGIVGPQTMIEISKAIGEGWKTSTPIVASPATSPTATPSGTPADSTIQPSPRQPRVDMTGLILLVLLAVGVWFFGGNKSK